MRTPTEAEKQEINRILADIKQKHPNLFSVSGANEETVMLFVPVESQDTSENNVTEQTVSECSLRKDTFEEILSKTYVDSRFEKAIIIDFVRIEFHKILDLLYELSEKGWTETSREEEKKPPPRDKSLAEKTQDALNEIYRNTSYLEAASQTFSSLWSAFSTTHVDPTQEKINEIKHILAKNPVDEFMLRGSLSAVHPETHRTLYDALKKYGALSDEVRAACAQS